MTAAFSVLTLVKFISQLRELFVGIIVLVHSAGFVDLSGDAVLTDTEIKSDGARRYEAVNRQMKSIYALCLLCAA